MDRESVEYLRRLSRLVLIEKNRREQEAIEQIQAGINIRLDEINRREEFMRRISGVIAEKDKEAADEETSSKKT